MTAEEVDRRETDNFLDWRREISQMEEKFPSMKVRKYFAVQHYEIIGLAFWNNF